MITKNVANRCAAKGKVLFFPCRGLTSAASGVRPYEEIPGPKPLPILGNAWRFLPGIGTIDMSDFRKFSRAIRKEYGDLIKISDIFGSKDLLMIYDPDLVAQVYKNEGQWPERQPLRLIKHFREKVRPDFFEGNIGLANENGTRWQEERTIINQPMMRVDVSNLYIPKSDKVAKDFVKVCKRLRLKNMEMPDNTKNEFNKWALESIGLIALDTRLGCLEPNLAPDSEAQRMIEAVIVSFDLSFDLEIKIPFLMHFPSSALKRYINYQEDILNISLKYVEEAKSKIKDINGPETPEMSVLHRLLRRNPSSKRAVIMAMDLLMAGVDTTANSASIALYHLAANPDKQELLYEELKSCVPADPNQAITAEHINKMKYLRACIKESTRLTPVAPVNSRNLQKDTVLANYLVPKDKANILLVSSALYADEQHYPEPDKFIPERWLRDKSVQCPVRKAHETHPYVYLPFGHGVRACPGMRFANMEMETLVARMLLAFKLEWHQPELKCITKFIQTTTSPLKFTLIDRE